MNIILIISIITNIEIKKAKKTHLKTNKTNNWIVLNTENRFMMLG